MGSAGSCASAGEGYVPYDPVDEADCRRAAFEEAGLIVEYGNPSDAPESDSNNFSTFDAFPNYPKCYATELFGVPYFLSYDAAGSVVEVNSYGYMYPNWAMPVCSKWVSKGDFFFVFVFCDYQDVNKILDSVPKYGVEICCIAVKYINKKKTGPCFRHHSKLPPSPHTHTDWRFFCSPLTLP